MPPKTRMTPDQVAADLRERGVKVDNTTPGGSRKPRNTQVPDLLSHIVKGMNVVEKDGK